MKLDGEQASRIAHEIYELVGHVIIGHEDGGNGKNRKWRLGKPLLKLWGIPVGETWIIIGFATTADYLGQIEIIKIASRLADELCQPRRRRVLHSRT